jgi:hypothetical protein
MVMDQAEERGTPLVLVAVDTEVMEDVVDIMVPFMETEVLLMVL